MAVAQIGQATHRQALRIGFAGGRKRFDVTDETFSGFEECVFAQVAHHPERMDHPVNYLVQKSLHHLEVVKG